MPGVAHWGSTSFIQSSLLLLRPKKEGISSSPWKPSVTWHGLVSTGGRKELWLRWGKGEKIQYWCRGGKDRRRNEKEWKEEQKKSNWGWKTSRHSWLCRNCGCQDWTVRLRRCQNFYSKSLFQSAQLKMQASTLGLGRDIQLQKTGEISENWKGEKGPQYNTGDGATGSCCTVRIISHHLRTPVGLPLLSLLQQALPQARGSREGPRGTCWACTLGDKGITMLKQLQEELFELGSVPWLTSQVRVMNQSNRRKQTEGRTGWTRRRSKSEGLMREIINLI